MNFTLTTKENEVGLGRLSWHWNSHIPNHSASSSPGYSGSAMYQNTDESPTAMGEPGAVPSSWHRQDSSPLQLLHSLRK